MPQSGGFSSLTRSTHQAGPVGKSHWYKRESGDPGADEPSPPGGRPEDVVGRVVRAGCEPVREQHGEERHEDGAEEKEEALVAPHVHDQGARSRHRGDEHDQELLRHARKRVLERDGRRVRVRERLVGLGYEECEERDDRCEPSRDNGGGKRSGIAEVAREHEHSAERE